MSDDIDKVNASDGVPSTGSGVRLALALCVAVGLLLRGLEATSSLWLDELHTLCVASRPTLAALNALLANDIHSPLFYVVVRAFYGSVDPPTLRWIAILGGMLAVIPLASIARSAGLGGPARVTVVGLFCALPFQVQWGAELRPYAWVQSFVLVLVWAAFTPSTSRGGRRLRFAAFALATALGLYTHLFTALAVLGIGFARLWIRRAEWLSLGSLVLAGLLGVLAFAPWLVPTHPWLLEDPTRPMQHDKLPEVDPHLSPSEQANAPAPGYDASGERVDAGRYWTAQKALQVPIQMLVPRMDSLGGKPALVAKASLAGLALGFAALAIASFARRSPAHGVPTIELVGAILAGAASALLVAIVCFGLANRVPLQYFIVAGWVWPLAFGALVQRAAPGLRPLAAGVLVVVAAAGGFAQVTGAPRENLRRGVEVALREARARDAWLTAVLWQPNFYSSTTPFWVYAPDERWVEPEDVPAVKDAGGARTLVVLTRSAPDVGVTNRIRWAPLRRGRVRTSVTHIDDGVSVYVYDMRRSTGRPTPPGGSAR